MFGMILDAANVDCAYVEFAYVEPFLIVSGYEVVEGLALCRTNGKLAFLNICWGTEMLRLDCASKCPDRFSRKDVCRAYPESCLEVVELNACGKLPLVGDIPSESVYVDWRVVDDVLGRWRSTGLPIVGPEAKNTFNMGARQRLSETACGPNDAELRLVNLSKLVDLATAVNTESISAEKALFGKVSMAYAGGPGVTPKLWCKGAA